MIEPNGIDQFRNSTPVGYTAANHGVMEFSTDEVKDTTIEDYYTFGIKDEKVLDNHTDMFYIGQTVIVKKCPERWSSLLNGLTGDYTTGYPLNLKYPWKGKIKLIETDKSYKPYQYVTAKIGRYCFDLSELIITDNISVAKRQTKLKVADIRKAMRINELVNSL